MPAPVSSPAAETAPAPAPEMADTNAPAAPTVKHIKRHKPVHHRPATPEPTVTLTPGSAEVNVAELTVRGQAGLKGELITHLHKGDTVNVLEQINLSHHAADEPSQWAKISYPTNSHIWVNSHFVKDGTVSIKKLNLRAGPGENYSVVGVVEQGTAINAIQTKGSWTQIDPPANAFAFVAARYLTEVAAATPPPQPPPAEMPETQTTVPNQPQIVVTPPQPPQPPQPTTPPVRIVSHQGIVGGVGSIIAPTAYKLYDQNTKQDIDYLYPISANIDLSRLVDDEVVVTGEEGIDPRWPNTPVIAIQSIQVLQTNVIKHLDLTIPRQRH